MLKAILRAHGPHSSKVTLRFENDGAQVEYIEKRAGCLISMVPQHAFQLTTPRAFTGPRFTSLNQGPEMHEPLAPGAYREVQIDLADFLGRRDAPVRARYVGTHRNLDTDEIRQIASNGVEVWL